MTEIEEKLLKVEEEFGNPYAELVKHVYKDTGLELIIANHRPAQKDKLGYNTMEINPKLVGVTNYSYHSQRMFDFRLPDDDLKICRGFVRFYIEQLPGNCGILLVHDFSFYYSNLAIFLNFILKVARYFNYSQIMLTNSGNNLEEEFIKFGFIKVSDIRNRRSGNYIQTYLYNLGKQNDRRISRPD